MPAITTTELVERAKAAADMHDSFVTNRQWMYWASQERMALDLFIARSGWTQAFETVVITVDGTEAGEFTPQTDYGIMAVVSVHEVTTQGVRLLRQADPITFLRVMPGATNGRNGDSREYRMRRVGDSVVLNLYPTPQAGETYLVTYLPHPLRLTLDATPADGYENTVSYPMGWEERIVLGMAKRALLKEESDITAITREIALMDQNIEELCWDRSIAESPTIRNSDLLNYGWTERLSYPPAINWWWG